MAALKFTIEIDAPEDRVWAFFAPQRMVYWYGREMEAEIEIQGGAADFALGQKVRITGKMGKKEVAHIAVVTRFEAGRTLEWQFRDPYGVRGAQAWDLEASSDGGTRVLMRDVYTFPGRLGPIVDALLTHHAVRIRDRAALRRLKRLAERR